MHGVGPGATPCRALKPTKHEQRGVAFREGGAEPAMRRRGVAPAAWMPAGAPRPGPACACRAARRGPPRAHARPPAGAVSAPPWAAAPAPGPHRFQLPSTLGCRSSWDARMPVSITHTPICRVIRGWAEEQLRSVTRTPIRGRAAAARAGARRRGPISRGAPPPLQAASRRTLPETQRSACLLGARGDLPGLLRGHLAQVPAVIAGVARVVGDAGGPVPLLRLRHLHHCARVRHAMREGSAGLASVCRGMQVRHAP